MDIYIYMHTKVLQRNQRSGYAPYAIFCPQVVLWPSFAPSCAELRRRLGEVVLEEGSTLEARLDSVESFGVGRPGLWLRLSARFPCKTRKGVPTPKFLDVFFFGLGVACFQVWRFFWGSEWWVSSLFPCATKKEVPVPSKTTKNVNPLAI